MDEHSENEDKTRSPSAVSELAQMVEELKKATAEAKKTLEEQKELLVLNALGGKTDAGVQPKEPKPETPREYAKRILSGKI